MQILPPPSVFQETSILIASFTAYYLVERALRAIVERYIHSPALITALKQSGKDRVYFSILLGALISISSFPICATATWQNRHSLFFAPSLEPPQSLAGDICITSRTILWISELNRLDLYPQYVYHHLGAVVMLLFVFCMGIPDILYMPFTSLVTEVTGDFVWIISAHCEMESGRERLMRVKQSLQNVNLWVYAIGRLPTIPLLAYTVFLCIQRRREALGDRWAVGLAVGTSLILAAYSGWIWIYLSRQWHARARVSARRENTDEKSQISRSKRMISFEHPIHLALPNGIIVTLYGPLMGTGLALLGFVAFLLVPSSTKSLSQTLLVTILCAVFFARVLCLLFEDTLTAFMKNPLRVFFRPGFWLHGGLIGAGLGIALSYTSGLVQLQEVGLLVASLSIGLPLYEVFSRMGCHTYGCCYGCTASEASSKSPSIHALITLFIQPVTYHSPAAAAVRQNPKLKDVALFPIQLVSSVLFLLQFVAIWAVTVHLRLLGIYQAGGLSLALHACIRLWTERFRSDFRGGRGWRISATGWFALIQLMVGMVGLKLFPFVDVRFPVDEKPWTSLVLDPWIQGCLLSIFSFGTVVYGMHRGAIGQGLVSGSVSR